MTRSSTAPTVLWFRRDLRLADHPALLDALAENRDVLGVFVADDTVLIPSGAPRRAFLAGCLERLSASLDGRLLITHGRPSVVIPEVAKAVGASAVHISADYGPYGRRRDARVEKALAELNVQLMATGSPYAVAPGRVRKPDGSPYAVFTPYFRGWTAHGWRRPAKPAGTVDWLDPAAVHGAPRLTPADIGAPVSSSTRLPEPGEAAAQETWRDFLQHNAAPADRPSSRPGRTASTATRTNETGPITLAPAGCRPTSNGVASTHARCWPTSPSAVPRAPLRTGENSPGGSSTPMSCSTDPHRCGRPSTPWWTSCAVTRVVSRTRGWPPGRRAAPDTRTSTPACGS